MSKRGAKLAVHCIRSGTFHEGQARTWLTRWPRWPGWGYPAVQFSAVGCMNGDTPEIDARQARKMLADNGLACIATHRGWNELMTQAGREIAFHHELGCDYAGDWRHSAAVRQHAGWLPGGLARGRHARDRQAQGRGHSSCRTSQSQPRVHALAGEKARQPAQYPGGGGGADLMLELDPLLGRTCGSACERVLETLPRPACR